MVGGGAVHCDGRLLAGFVSTSRGPDASVTEFHDPAPKRDKTLWTSHRR